MEFLNSWLQGIIVAVIVAKIIQMILPNGNNKKYVKVVLGVYVVFNIITPIINKFFDSSFEISSIINMKEYTKKMEIYEVNSNSIDIESSNKKNIEDVYIKGLINDMKAKINDKGYSVKNIDIELEDTQEYKIKKIKILLDNSKYNNDKEKNENKQNNDQDSKVIINEVKQVNIKLSNTEKENDINQTEDRISLNEKQQIINYLSSIYEVNEKQIEIN